MRYDNGYGNAGRYRFGERGAGDEPRGGRIRGRSTRSRYGGDFWWLGEREMRRNADARGYDDAFQRFSDTHRPRFTPVGGMYPAMGGSLAEDRAPRPLREPMRFSEWTRWF